MFTNRYPPTFPDEYIRSNIGTKNELVYIDPTILNKKRLVYENWHFLKNNISYEKRRHEGWTPCAYYDQLNKAINASHSIFNYSNFLAFLPYLNNLPARELLVLDEGHLIEAEVLKHVGISISRNWFRKYFPYFRIEPSDNDEYGDDEIDRWGDFLMNCGRGPAGSRFSQPDAVALVREGLERR